MWRWAVDTEIGMFIIIWQWELPCPSVNESHRSPTQVANVASKEVRGKHLLIAKALRNTSLQTLKD